jgi:WXG100 family type VII secretion target
MRIKVNMTELQHTAQQIDSQIADFEKIYKVMYEMVNHMGNAWEGKDNKEFVKKMNEFRYDLDQLKQLLSEYPKLLVNCANSYSKTQQRLVDRARDLAN